MVNKLVEFKHDMEDVEIQAATKLMLLRSAWNWMLQADLNLVKTRYKCIGGPVTYYSINDEMKMAAIIKTTWDFSAKNKHLFSTFLKTENTLKSVEYSRK